MKNPATEVTVDDFFINDPGSLTDADLDKLIADFRAARTAYFNKERAKLAKKSAAGESIDSSSWADATLDDV